MTGWQLMALKNRPDGRPGSAIASVSLADKFLDSVETEKSAAYGYLRPGEGPATTSVGLLCRMYLGWNRQRRALMVGVTNLTSSDPRPPICITITTPRRSCSTTAAPAGMAGKEIARILDQHAIEKKGTKTAVGTSSTATATKEAGCTTPPWQF